MLKKLPGIVAALLVCLPAVCVAGLKPGDPAPMLKVSKFVKGEPISHFEPGRLYVVEFWATWCGPCRVSIPHLTEMQKKYPNVKFIGVSVWENDQSAVEPFVKQMGDKMDYTVAMDDIPAGAKANTGYMAQNWMAAAGQNGIPTAFVVDKDSRIAWIGHPMTIDEPLSKITAGNWDVNAEAAKFATAQAAQEKMMALQTKLGGELRAKDFSGALATVNGAVSETPSLEPMLAPLKLNLLDKLGRKAEARTYTSYLVNVRYKDDPNGLNSVAWPIVDPSRAQKADTADARLALKAALRADELSGHKNPAILDTLAAAYYANGDVVRAVTTQQRAIATAKGTAEESDKSLQQHLDLYTKGKG